MNQSIRKTLLGALSTLLFACPLAAQDGQGEFPDSEPRNSLEEFEDTMRFGYSLEDGDVALVPSTRYVYCPELGTLILHPEYIDFAADDLQAEVNGFDQWTIDHQAVQPQIARYAIATQYNEADLADEALLEPIGIGRVLMPARIEGACSTSVSGWVCGSTPCRKACSNGVESLGPVRIKGCTHTGNRRDSCKLTGNTKTCTIKSWAKANCTKPLMSTLTVKTEECK